MRSRAASSSESVGAVCVVNVEHLLKDFPNGRQRVEAASLDVGKQPLQLHIALHCVLDVPACAVGRDLEHLGGEVPAPSRLELAPRLEPLPVLLDLLPQLLDPFAALRL